MQNEEQPEPLILTADVGGSHITAGLCNNKTGFIDPQSIARMNINSKGTATEILNGWVAALRSVLNKTGMPVGGVAMAMPGPFEYDKGIAYIKGLSKYESIYGMDIRAHLAGELNIDPLLIRFRNDAESTIAGEVLAGAGRDYNRIIGVTLGTGFGSAFSANQQTTDLNLGSDPYKKSIADDYFSTRWFTKRYHEITDQTLTGGVKELAGLAEASEQLKFIFDEFAEGLSSFLAKPLAQTEAEVLVICGNIGKASKFFLPQLKRHLHYIAVELAQLGENAPLIGAAAVFKSDESNPPFLQPKNH